MKMSAAVVALCALALGSCTSTETYRTHSPEEHGERAITSTVELVKEINLGSRGSSGGASSLGVFFSRETFQGGSDDSILFSVRTDTKGEGTIGDYELVDDSSLSVEQAGKLLTSIDAYLKMDPRSLTPAKLLNFELSAGSRDLAAGSEKYRPFREVLFIISSTVTSTGKTFKTMFAKPMGAFQRTPTYTTYELTEVEVGKLREAIAAAVGKAGAAAPAAKDKAGS